MFFKHQHYTIVTRAGIEKIQQAENIRITYEIVEGNTQEGIVTLHARGYRAEEPDYVVETFGEVNPKNNRNAYPWAGREESTEQDCIEAKWSVLRGCLRGRRN